MFKEDEEPALPCSEKMVFDTKTQATAAGVVADWQHGAKLRAYKCRHCQLWHLATKHNE